MKRICVLALTVVFLTMAAMAEEVKSVNVVGYARVLLPAGGRILGAMGFDNLEDSGINTVMSVFGTNQLVAAANYLNADRVVLYDTGDSMYRNYALYNGDYLFYPCNSAVEWEGSSATNPIIPVGSGFWVVSQGAPAKDIVFVGEVVTFPTQLVDIVPGYQIVSYGFSSDIAVQDINTDGMIAAANYLNADRLVVWEGDNYQAYALYTDDTWYMCNSAPEWELSIPASNNLSLGESVWFISATNVTKPSSFTWSETNRYLQNL